MKGSATSEGQKDNFVAKNCDWRLVTEFFANEIPSCHGRRTYWGGGGGGGSAVIMHQIATWRRLIFFGLQLCAVQMFLELNRCSFDVGENDQSWKNEDRNARVVLLVAISCFRKLRLKFNRLDAERVRTTAVPTTTTAKKLNECSLPCRSTGRTFLKWSRIPSAQTLKKAFNVVLISMNIYFQGMDHRKNQRYHAWLAR